jgi:uncharacterized protein (DUF58 family)
LLVLQLIAPYRGWRILLVGLGGMWLLSYLWARSLAHGLQLVREMRFGWAQVGDEMVERFTLANDGWAPALWVEVEDRSTLPNYQAGRGTRVSAGRSVRWHTEAVCARRGLYTLGPTSLRTGDPFGLYTVTLDYAASLPLMVLPPIVPLPTIEVSPGGRTGEGRPRANAFERTVSAAGVREHVPGDSVRWIHWRTSARRDALFVRLFDGTPASDRWIFLDMDHAVQMGGGRDSTEEHGVILAASLADQGLRSGWAVGLAAHGEQLVWLPPRDGEVQRWEILRALAMVSLGARPLVELLTRAGPALGQYASLVIVTPSSDTVWIEALVPLLRRGAIPTVLLLDPVSFDGTGDQGAIRASLTDLGVAHYVITRDLLDRPEIRPGQSQVWERMAAGSERSASFHQLPGAAWRVLSS